MWCMADNNNYICHIMCKETLTFEFQLSSYRQNIKFSRNYSKFHIFTKIVIFEVYLHFFKPTDTASSHGGRDMSGILFYFCQL